MSDAVKKQCSVDGCDQTRRTRGWCIAHYTRWRAHGDPLHGGAVRGRHRTVEERLFALVEKTETCWIWIGSTSGDNYGKIKIDGRHRRAHRVSYELHVGEIPADREIDHRCHNTRCVNPAHLRIATHKENCENKAGAQRNSRTGVRGVVETRNGRFKALVQHCGRQIYVGTFDTLAEADAAARAKRRELFTHSDADLEIGQLELFGSAVSA